MLMWTIPPLATSKDDEANQPEQVAVERFFDHYREFLYPFGTVSLVLLTAYFSGMELTIYHHIAGYFTAVVASALIKLTRKNKRWRERMAPTIFDVSCAFLISLFWIYIATKELLNALTAFGRTSGVHEAVLGITILAWGNSCGDLVGNVALSQNGNAETAIIASLSGPIQNVLLTIGVSFLIACVKAPDMKIILGKPDVIFYVTCGTLITTLLLLLVTVPFVFKYRLPRWLGMVLLSLYAVYLTISLTLVVYKQKK